MAESEVVRIAREYREQLARNEDQALRRMARSWAQMEKELNSSYIALSEDIRALMDSGTAVPKELILTRIRYQQMMAQIEQFLTEYDKTAVQTITYYQKENFNLGLDSASAQLRYSVEEDDIWNKIGRDSAETIAGFAGNGAPLGELLRHDYGDIGNEIADRLIVGMGLGKGSLAIADEIADILGEKEYSRAVRIARTEVNRAYRIANADQYRASGVVAKVLRLCYPPTACFACLMMDGEECQNFMVDDHPNGKCTGIAVTIGGNYPEWQRGKEWFLEQDPMTQREIMGDTRYEMWKSGIPLQSMVRMQPNPVWGSSPSTLTLTELRSIYVTPFEKYAPQQDIFELANSGAKFDNDTVRNMYNYAVSKIAGQINNAFSLEDQAKQASEIRNRIRTAARKIMSSTEEASELNRERPNLSFEELIERKMVGKGLSREDALRDIIRTASKTNEEVNSRYGSGKK